MNRKEFQTLPRSFRQYINQAYLDVEKDLIDYKDDKVMYERAIGQRQMLRRLFGDNLEYRFEVGDKVIANHPYVSEHGEVIEIISQYNVRVRLLDGQTVSCPVSKLELWVEPTLTSITETSNDNIDWEQRRYEVVKALITAGKFLSGKSENPADIVNMAESVCHTLKSQTNHGEDHYQHREIK